MAIMCLLAMQGLDTWSMFGDLCDQELRLLHKAYCFVLCEVQHEVLCMLCGSSGM